MSQDLKPLVLWKHEPKPQNPWSSENISQDPKILGLWKHEPGSRTFGPLKTWARILNLWSSENMSQSPKILGLWKHEPGSKTFDPLKTWVEAQKSLVFWKHEPGSIVLQVSISSTHSKKKKKKNFACMNYVWTWSLHQEVRRQSPSRFGPHFDPLHDHLHFYLHALYIHHG